MNYDTHLGGGGGVAKKSEGAALKKVIILIIHDNGISYSSQKLSKTKTSLCHRNKKKVCVTIQTERE